MACLVLGGAIRGGVVHDDRSTLGIAQIVAIPFLQHNLALVPLPRCLPGHAKGIAELFPAGSFRAGSLPSPSTAGR